jgi:Clr5 domain
MSTPRPQPYSKQAPRATPFPGDEWARIKDKFEELYIKKGWTLKKVMKYMQKHMKFNAK